MIGLNHSRKINGTWHEGDKTPREYFPVGVSRDVGLLALGWAASRAEERGFDIRRNVR